MITAKISATGNPEKMFECMEMEQTSFDRSSFTIKKVEDGLEFNVEAKDATALRSSLNTISQLLIIFEKASKQ